MPDFTLQDIDRWLLSASTNEICLAEPSIFSFDKQHQVFARIRNVAPVHRCRHSIYGDFWSITKYKHIVEIGNMPTLFSSAAGFTLDDPVSNAPRSFMRMDPPEHQHTRRLMSSLASRDKLERLRPFIEEIVGHVFDTSPLHQPIDWVTDVAARISSRVFCELLGVPIADSPLLEAWAQAAMTAALTMQGGKESYRATLSACHAYFREKINQSLARESSNLLSMLVHANTANPRSEEDLMADIMILLIGGMETVKHAMTGSILLFDRYPSELLALREDPSIVASAMSEVLRMQSPFAYMRRTVVNEVDFHGELFQPGDKVALWYISANRDSEIFPDPDVFQINRKNSSSHLSFGSGPHQCIGKHLALLQLEVVWRTLIMRDLVVKPIATAQKVKSSFINGFSSLLVELHASC